MFLIVLSALALVVVLVLPAFVVHAERHRRVRAYSARLGLSLADPQVRSTALLAKNLTKLARRCEGAGPEDLAGGRDPEALEAWRGEEPFVLGLACAWAILRLGLYEAPFDQLLFGLFRHDYLFRRFGEEGAERGLRYYLEAVDRPAGGAGEGPAASRAAAAAAEPESAPARVRQAFMQRTGIRDPRILDFVATRFARAVAMNRDVQSKLRPLLPALSSFFRDDSPVELAV